MNPLKKRLKLLLEKSDLLPSRFEQECTHLIQEYTHDIVQLLIKEFTLSPSEICKMIHLRSSRQHKRYYKSVARPLSSVTKGVMCEVCVMTVEALEKKLTKESTKDEIAKALETVCNAFAISSLVDSLVSFFSKASTVITHTSHITPFVTDER